MFSWRPRLAEKLPDITLILYFDVCKYKVDYLQVILPDFAMCKQTRQGGIECLGLEYVR